MAKRTNLSNIPEDDWTYYERMYHHHQPSHFYVIMDDWNERTRDVMALLKVEQHLIFEEHGTHRTNRYQKFLRWVDAILAGERCQEAEDHYDKTVAEREAASLGSYSSSRKHVDGRLLDGYGQTIGYWKDPAPGTYEVPLTLINKASSYYCANCHRKDRNFGENWLRVMLAFGKVFDGSHGRIVNGRGYNVEDDETIAWNDPRWDRPHHDTVRRAVTLTPYTAKEAWDSAEIWDGWREFAEALEKLEAEGKVCGVPPDVTAAYNEDMGTSMPVSGHKGQEGPPGRPGVEVSPSISPQVRAETPPKDGVAPGHKDRFIAYLKRERDLVAHECGSQHPAIKCGVYESYIRKIENGERLHSQIMFNYDQFLAWLRGEHGQRTVDDTNVWADGTVDDLSVQPEATASCEVPVDIAYALKSGDWAKVARLAQKRATGG